MIYSYHGLPGSGTRDPDEENMRMGMGMSRCLHPIFQADAGIRQGEGTGLARAIGRACAQLPGGGLEVHGALPTGSAFIPRLPVTVADSAPVVPPVVRSRRVSGPTTAACAGWRRPANVNPAGLNFRRQGPLIIAIGTWSTGPTQAKSGTDRCCRRISAIAQESG